MAVSTALLYKDTVTQGEGGWKHTMPRVLHNPPTEIILKWRLRQPFPEPHIVTLGPFADLPVRDSKLRAARYANLVWYVNPREQLHEAVLEILPRMHIVTVGIRVRVDLRRTSESPCTAQIDIALLLEIRHLETTEHGDSVVVGIVVVPLEGENTDR